MNEHNIHLAYDMHQDSITIAKWCGVFAACTESGGSAPFYAVTVTVAWLRGGWRAREFRPGADESGRLCLRTRASGHLLHATPALLGEPVDALVLHHQSRLG